MYQSMKSVYGIHACHLLQINSVNHTGCNPLPNLPDPWSQFIIPTSEDTLVRRTHCCNRLSLNSDLSQMSHCSIKGLSVGEGTTIENMITQVKFS